MEKFNRFLESNSFILNDSGGKIKISPDQHLLQSSTVARMVEATFSGGETIFIPGSYVEFAERKVLPRYSNLPPQQIKRADRGHDEGASDHRPAHVVRILPPRPWIQNQSPKAGQLH